MAECFPEGVCCASNWQMSISSYLLQLFPLSGNRGQVSRLGRHVLLKSLAFESQIKICCWKDNIGEICVKAVLVVKLGYFSFVACMS